MKELLSNFCCSSPFKIDDHFWIYYLLTPLLAILALTLLIGSIYCARSCQQRKPSMEAICLSANEMFAQQLHQQHLLQSNSLGNSSSTAATPLRMTLPFSYGRLATSLQANGQPQQPPPPNNLSTGSSKQSNQSLLSNVLNSVAHPGRALGTAIGQSMKNNGNNPNNKLIDPSAQNNLELKALLSANESPATATSSHYALSSMFPVNSINITGNPISNGLIHYPLHCLRILTRIYPRLSSHNQMEASNYSGSSGNEEPPSTHLKSSLNYQFYAGQLTVSNQIQPVTIRALKLTGDAENVTAFAEQAAQLCALSHENLIRMLGVSIGANNHSTIPQHFIIFEQFSPVNLLHFLQQQPLPSQNGSSTFNSNAPNNPGGHFVENVDLLQIAYQIANGMQFLSENGYVHGDLACRNCYINNSSPSSGDHQRFRVKIGGLHLQNLNGQNARWLMANENSSAGKKSFKKDLTNQELKEELVEEHLDDQDYYTLNVQRKALPVRWLPPECLLSLEYSTASDIWSYGVTLWELMSYGRQIPFQSYGNAQAVDQIVAGRLLDRPTYCEPSFYALILECWREVPAQRSGFAELAQKLAQFINGSHSNWLPNQTRNRVCSPMPTSQTQASKVNGWLLNSNEFNGSSNYLSNNGSKGAALKTNTMNSNSTYASSYHQSSSPNYNYNLANNSTAGNQVEYDQPFVQINDLESSHKLIKPTLSTFQSGKPRNGLTVGLKHLELKNGHLINYSNSKLDSKQDDYSENHYSRLTYDDETESMLSSSFGLI